MGCRIISYMNQTKKNHPKAYTILAIFWRIFDAALFFAYADDLSSNLYGKNIKEKSFEPAQLNKPHSEVN